MNNINVVGRLVKDVVLGEIPGGTKKIEGVVAVDRAYKKEGRQNTDYIPFNYLGKNLDKLASYMNKGTLVAINGELHIDSFNKDGEYKNYTKISVNRLELLGGKGNVEAKEEKEAVEFTPDNGFSAVDDEDIPF